MTIIEMANLVLVGANVVVCIGLFREVAKTKRLQRETSEILAKASAFKREYKRRASTKVSNMVEAPTANPVQ